MTDGGLGYHKIGQIALTAWVPILTITDLDRGGGGGETSASAKVSFEVSPGNC